MNFEPLRRLFSDRAFFSLDVRLARGLLPIAYVTGLFCIVLWALNHLLWRFFQGWAEALWGIVEVIGFGALLVLALRIVAEGLMVLFKEPIEREAEPVLRPRLTPSMMEEVNEAIQDLGEDEQPVVEEKPVAAPARPRQTKARPIVSEPLPEPEAPVRSPAIKRTAKRSQPRSTET